MKKIKALSNQNGYKCSKWKTVLEAVEKASVKGDVPQVAMDLWEGASVAWLRAEIDDQDKSLVSTLQCIVCRQYETRMCGPKNFSRARTNSSSNHKKSNITDNTNSEPHKAAMMYFHVLLYVYTVIIAQCTSMKCVRSTFCDGWSSYILVWQSSGCYRVDIFIPKVECDKSEPHSQRRNML